MELVQSEQVVEALLDYFVSPLLPRRRSTDNLPTDDQQILMAKQMHPVVVLYNYYHRKQYPCNKFHDFDSFCKISCMTKPKLVPYLRSMHNCNHISEKLSDPYMITEKSVMDAVFISVNLDPSNKNPTMDAWPISKVAILLVDSKKENCVLFYNYNFQGVWSLMEKELACCDNKLLLTESYESENELERFAFSTVEKDTGIGVQNLNILECHLAYSLSHEKTASRLYIMKFKGVPRKGISLVCIKDMLTSLEGPVVQDGLTSSVVEYYSILPYYEIISHWLSRQNSGQQVDDNEKFGLNSTKDLKVKIRYVATKPENDVQSKKLSDSNRVIETKNKSADSNSIGSGSRSCKREPSDKNKVAGDFSKYESSRIDRDIDNKVNKSCTQQEKLSIKNDKLICHSILQKDQDSKLVNMPTDKNLLKGANTCNKGIEEMHRATSCSNTKESKQSMNGNHGLEADSDEKKLKTEIKLSVKSNGIDSKNVSCPSSNILATEDIIKNVEALCRGQKNSQCGEENGISIYNFGSGDHDVHCVQHASVDGVAEQVAMVESGKCITKHVAEDSTSENLSLVPTQPGSTDYGKLYHTLISKKNEFMQAVVHILQNKLDEMQQQKLMLDDKIAGCEMNIQMMLKECEINRTQDVESILKVLNSHCPNPQPTYMNSFPEHVKRRKLSEVVLGLKSSCQELDNICRRSCWLLPRYTVIPSLKNHEITGLFKAIVELHGADFEIRSEGDEKSSLSEARESAACHMLTKLRNYE